MASIMDELRVPKQLYAQPSPMIPLLLISVVAAMVGVPYYFWVRIEEPLVEMVSLGPLVIPLLLLLALRLLYCSRPSSSSSSSSLHMATPVYYHSTNCIHRRSATASSSSDSSSDHQQPASFGWGLLALLVLYFILLPLVNR